MHLKILDQGEKNAELAKNILWYLSTVYNIQKACQKTDWSSENSHWKIPEKIGLKKTAELAWVISTYLMLVKWNFQEASHKTEWLRAN